MKSYTLKLLFFSLLVGGLDFCWNYLISPKYYIPFTWILLVFFASTTWISHAISVNASKGKPQQFIRFYMGLSALRLFLSLLIIVLYRFYDKNSLNPFAIGFMIHYFLFTIFEIPSILKEVN